MADNPRIEELRRRVLKDPASIAFAQLAEEYRRAGSYEDAIEACRSGLAIHPGYLSARVTLGRALLEMNDLDAALGELEYVLKTAPENLAAIRGVAEIHHRRGALGEALGFYRAALALAKPTPTSNRRSTQSRAHSLPSAPWRLMGYRSRGERRFLMALEDLPGGIEAALAPSPPHPLHASHHATPALPKLERFLDPIHTTAKKAV